MRLGLDGTSVGGTTTLYINGEPVDFGPNVTAGNPQVWNGKPLFQAGVGVDRGGVLVGVRYFLATGPPLEGVDEQGQTHLFASAGTDFYAARLNGYRDSHGTVIPEWAPVAVDDTSSRAAVVYNGTLCVWDGAALTLVDASGADTWEKGDIHFSRGVLGYRKHGQLVTWGRPSPVQIPGQGVRFDGDYVLAWQEGRGLVLHTWNSTQGLVISTEGDNFNPDIRDLGNRRVRIVAGVNNGDEGEYRYDVDWAAGLVNGEMRVRVDLSIAPAEPIVAIDRPYWLAWFAFHGVSTDAPHNALLAVETKTYVTDVHGHKIARYVSAPDDSDLGQLETVIAQVRAEEPWMPVLSYWTRQAQRIGIPSSDMVGVEAYRGVDESVAAFEQRVDTNAGRVRRPWLITQCYSSNLNNTSDLASIPAPISRVTRRNRHIEGILPFSGAGRDSGYQDHPEVWGRWRELAAGIPSAPVIVTPEPVPTPTPPPAPVPGPVPPAPFFPSVKELQMADSEIHGVIFGGFYGRVDPAEPGRIYWDQTTCVAHGRVEVTKPDGLYCCRFVDANVLICFLGAPDAPIGSFVRCFETRPANARGPSESPVIVKYPNGLVVATAEYVVDGRHYMSCALTLVKQ